MAPDHDDGEKTSWQEGRWTGDDLVKSSWSSRRRRAGWSGVFATG